MRLNLEWGSAESVASWPRLSEESRSLQQRAMSRDFLSGGKGSEMADLLWILRTVKHNAGRYHTR